MYKNAIQIPQIPEITPQEMEQTNYAHIHQPGTVLPIETPTNFFTDENIKTIKQRVIEGLDSYGLHGLDAEDDVVKDQMIYHFRSLWPFISPDKLIFRCADTIIKDTIEKYFQIRWMSEQYKGSSYDVNIDRIRRRMPKKPVAYVDIS